MAFRVEMALLTAILLVHVKATTAEDFGIEWIFPNGPFSYSKFHLTNYTLGDSFVFNFNPRFHSLLLVSEAAYDACNVTEPLREWKDGDNRVVLDRAGEWRFICGTSLHCSKGMAFKVSVHAPSAGKTLTKETGSRRPSPAPSPQASASATSARPPSQHALTVAATLVGTSYLLRFAT